MYGLVNRAIEDLVTEQAGGATWRQVLQRAGVDIPAFISNEPYDDAITYRLVAAASDLLAVPADTLLRRFGEHWVLRTAREHYGPLLAHGGATLSEFLLNLPNFHQRVTLIFPSLRPPSFAVRAVGPRHLMLIYRSQREGLAPFVVGLLHGLGTMFATPVTVEHVLVRTSADGHDEFAVTW